MNELYEGVHFTTEQVEPRLVKQHNAWSIVRTYTDIDGKIHTNFAGRLSDGFGATMKMNGYQAVSFKTRWDARQFVRVLKTRLVFIGSRFKVVKVLIAMADVS